MIVNDDGTVGSFGCFIFLLCITFLRVALLGLIARTLAPFLAFALRGDCHVYGTLLGVVQPKQHRLELHRHAAVARCTHPPLHMHGFAVGHVGQSFDGGNAGARRAPLRRHHMGTGRAPGRSAFLLLRYLFCVIRHSDFNVLVEPIQFQCTVEGPCGALARQMSCGIRRTYALGSGARCSSAAGQERRAAVLGSTDCARACTGW